MYRPGKNVGKLCGAQPISFCKDQGMASFLEARYLSMPEDLRPVSPAQAIQDCDRDLFPNIFTLLQIACTIPVTSCDCERSASALRRLHNYMRASMTTTRLSSLALLHVHYDDEVDLDDAVSLFTQLHPRRIELSTLSLLHHGNV